MLSFGRKRADGIKPLTEEEIQKKLYGEFKKMDRIDAVGDHPAAASELFTKQEKAVDVIPFTDKELFTFNDTMTPEPVSDSGSAAVSETDIRVHVRQDEQSAGHARTQSASAFDVATHVDDEQKTEEQCAYSYEEPKPAPAVSFVQSPSPSRDQRKELLASLKVSGQELLEKIARIPMMVIGIVLGVLLVLVIAFNVWSRSAHEPSAVAPEPQDVTSLPADVVVTPVVPPAAGTPAEPSAATPSSTAATTTPAAVTVSAPPPVVEELTAAFYSVQVCVYEDAEHANALIKDLKATGDDAFYRTMKTRSGRELFTVFYGKYKTLQEANGAFKTYKQTATYKKFPDSFIKWLK